MREYANHWNGLVLVGNWQRHCKRVDGWHGILVIINEDPLCPQIPVKFSLKDREFPLECFQSFCENCSPREPRELWKRQQSEWVWRQCQWQFLCSVNASFHCCHRHLKPQWCPLLWMRFMAHAIVVRLSKSHFWFFFHITSIWMRSQQIR